MLKSEDILTSLNQGAEIAHLYSELKTCKREIKMLRDHISYNETFRKKMSPYFWDFLMQRSDAKNGKIHHIPEVQENLLSAFDKTSIQRFKKHWGNISNQEIYERMYNQAMNGKINAELDKYLVQESEILEEINALKKLHTPGVVPTVCRGIGKSVEFIIGPLRP